MANRERPIYLDYQATTPVDPRVLASMLPYFGEIFGNPQSSHHSFGAEAESAVKHAREQIASLIGAEASELVFTSGATESNNLALRGAADLLRQRGLCHVVTSQIEHKSVLEVCHYLEVRGFHVTYLPVRESGIVDPSEVQAALTGETGLVSIMAVNNEIGTIQPLSEIGRLCAERGILFHSDAAQAAGKIDLDVKGLNIDLLSLSAHKLYGPKGIGALYVRRRPRIRLESLILGGGQESGIRSGTVPVPLCVGFGEACDLARTEFVAEQRRLVMLRERFLLGLRNCDLRFELNGSLDRRIAGNLNLSFARIDAEALLLRLRETVAISSGAACTTGRLDPSHVLLALGITEERAESAIRIGFGRFTTEEEVDRAVSCILEAAASLARLSQRGAINAHG